MEQEHKPLWSDKELRNRAYDIALGYNLPLELITRIENALIVMRSESEAALSEQAQRVAALEALRREQYERANGLSESNNALLDENIAYRQRVEQLEAEVARLKAQVNAAPDAAQEER